MKNINYIINGVLILAVIILFVMHFSGKKESGKAQTFTTGVDETDGLLPIAYVNVDSLLSNYSYSKDLNEVILRKQEDSRANINQKANTLRSDMQEFERKYKNNAFLTPQRAQEEQQRLLNKQQELQALDERLTQELMLEQQKLNQQLRDTIVSHLKVFNQTKGYQVIFSNTMGDNILLAGDAYDITSEFIGYLNKNYTSPNK
ncbi:MAG: OmpH family outer membrane protein [Massilibacteroides sp.]|nr:OmpH family outer membrane protein [Massilibacteroides sp.]MDD3061403.1 OmpH family outer membrane protein [Massilibacteroides sp.]MDD4115005.1 OmpH family outer membrane protein [Massilibacteroides sp.]MDD4659494.1 OmpH family outer membrane protein [Massilibacteroides sp.]